MKHKILSFLTAFAMVFGIVAAPFVNASAAEEPHKTDVVLHKIELSDLTGWPKGEGKENDDYDGSKLDIENYFGTDAKELAGVKFYYYKLADEEQFKAVQKDTENNKTKEKLEEKYTALKDQAKTVTSAVGGVKIAGLEDGYYWFVEDSSSFTDDNGRTITDGKAVPFGLKLPVYKEDGSMFGTGTDNELHVYPKNTLVEKPEMDKNFDKEDNAKTNAKGVKKEDLVGENSNLELDLKNNQKDKPTATRNIGDKVPYKVETKIPQGAKYQKLVWTDVMTNGLTFDKDSLTIEGGNIGTNYEIVEDDRGFTLKLTDAGLKAVEEAAKNAEVTITLKYSATINKDAEVDTTDENDIALDYGNKPGHEDTPKEGNPSEGKISVKKSWARPGENGTITDADANAKVVYTLQIKDGDTWKNVKSVQVGAKEEFKYTFDKLDDTKTYRVIERVSGYEPQYTSFNNGVVEITNKGDKENPKPIDPSEPKVVTGGKKFVKTDEKEARLSGAQFYVKNKAGEYLVPTTDNSEEVEAAKTERDNALKAYNERKQGANESKEDFEAARKTLRETFEQKQKEYFEKFEANATAYTFSKDKTNALVLASDKGGRLSIKGLAYGEYKLEEKEAPAGYAKQTKDIDFKVENGSYEGAGTDTEKHIDYKATDADTTQGKQIVNKKVTIPQTGGIGSIIFVIAGLMIMGLAAYKMKANKEQA